MKQMQAEHETSAPRLMTRGRAALFALCCAGFALYGVYCNGFGTNAEAAMAYFGIDEVQNGTILTVQSAGCLAAAVFLGLFGANGNAASDFVSITLLKNNVFLLAVSAIACTPLVKTMANGAGTRLRRSRSGERLFNLMAYIVFPIVLLLLSTASLVGDSYNPFIYFQF